MPCSVYGKNYGRHWRNKKNNLCFRCGLLMEKNSRTLETKACFHCGKDVKREPCKMVGKIFCSRSCVGESRNRKITLQCANCRKPYQRTRSQLQQKGSSNCSKKCLSESMKGLIGPKAKHWKEEVGYGGIHDWIRRTAGRPIQCHFCERTKQDGIRRFHWANVSGEYRRELSDWLQACPECHSIFDSHSNITSVNRLKTL